MFIRYYGKILNILSIFAKYKKIIYYGWPNAINYLKNFCHKDLQIPLMRSNLII